jgi:predicted nucleotidyltransferase
MIREGVKLPKDVQNRIPELVHVLACDKDVVALYAFGSLANNSLKPLSDLDFGFLFDSRLNKRQRSDKHLALIGLFTDTLKTEEIDVINMRDAPHRIAFQILKTGTLLFCSDKLALTDFREVMIKSYLDFKHVINAFDAVFLRGIGYHG